MVDGAFSTEKKKKERNLIAISVVSPKLTLRMDVFPSWQTHRVRSLEKNASFVFVVMA